MVMLWLSKKMPLKKGSDDITTEHGGCLMRCELEGASLAL